MAKSKEEHNNVRDKQKPTNSNVIKKRNHLKSLR